MTPKSGTIAELRGRRREVVKVTAEYVRWRLPLDDTRDIIRTDYLLDGELIALNQQAFNDSRSKRFGGGKGRLFVPLIKRSADGEWGLVDGTVNRGGADRSITG